MLSWLFTPRVAQTKAYVAQRDAELWSRLFSDGTNGSALSIDTSSKAVSKRTSNKSAHSVDPQSLPAVELEVQKGDVEILSCNIEQMVEAMKQKRFTAVQVTSAFIRSARRAHVKSNCLTEIMFESALARAHELDAEFAKTGELAGPLHGVPFSIKDHILTKGQRSTIGFTDWISSRGLSDESAALVELFESFGAIPLCKTNIPQTMLSFECSNPLWGRTSNPHNTQHTSGGSSGGEAALSASDGAAFGIGSDIGGSLRIPTGYCGIYAIKPTKGRFPTRGTAKFSEGFEGINVVLAPMGRCLEDIEYLTRLTVQTLHPAPGSEGPSAREMQIKYKTEYLRTQPLDGAHFEPLQLLEEKRGRKGPLRVGYYTFDGFSKPSPAVIRSMDEATAALKKTYGPEQVELVPIDTAKLRSKEALNIFLALTSADAFEGLIKPLKGDPMEPSLYLPVLTARLPWLLRKLVRFLLLYVLRDRVLGTAIGRSGAKSIAQYNTAVADRQAFTTRFEREVWQAYELDAIVCPLQPTPAIAHGGAAKLSPVAIATILFNVMDNAASIVPVTRVDPARDAADASQWKQWRDDPRYKGDNSSWLVNRTLYTEKQYDAQRMKDLPVSVQVVSGQSRSTPKRWIERRADLVCPPFASRRSAARWRRSSALDLPRCSTRRSARADSDQETLLSVITSRVVWRALPVTVSYTLLASLCTAFSQWDVHNVCIHPYYEYSYVSPHRGRWEPVRPSTGSSLVKPGRS